MLIPIKIVNKIIPIANFSLDPNIIFNIVIGPNIKRITPYASYNYPYFSGITGGRGSCIYSANIATYVYSNSNFKLAKDNFYAMKTALFINPYYF